MSDITGRIGRIVTVKVIWVLVAALTIGGCTSTRPMQFGNLEAVKAHLVAKGIDKVETLSVWYGPAAASVVCIAPCRGK